jgi:hypothetical protein
MRVWTDGQTHVIETREGVTSQTDDTHVHEAGAGALRWCSKALNGTVPADCVAVARAPDGRVIGVRMPSRRAGANLVPLRQADEGWVWGRPFNIPKAVRADFREIWPPGAAPFSRGRKLGQAIRHVSLTTSPFGVCLADPGTGIVCALRKGADEVVQAIRVPADDDVAVDAVCTQSGFLVQIVAGGRDAALVRFGPTGAHRGSVVSTGPKGEVQILADGSRLHAGLFDGDFHIRLVDPATLETRVVLPTHGLDQVDVATAVNAERDRFVVTDGRVVVLGEMLPEGGWMTRPLGTHVGEAPKAAEPPALSVREQSVDVRPGPFQHDVSVTNRGGPCSSFVLRVSNHDAVHVERITIERHTLALFENRKLQAREARIDDLVLHGDFTVTLHGEARLVAEAPVEIGLYRTGGELLATGTWTVRIQGAEVVCCRTVDDTASSYSMSSRELANLVDVMTALGVVDTDTRTPDLNRWTDRACRRIGVDEPPQASSPHFEQWRDTWMQLTARDRAVSAPDGRPPLFKFAADHPWHVTPQECASIVRGLSNVPNDHVRSWVTFAQQASVSGGFLVLTQ